MAPHGQDEDAPGEIAEGALWPTRGAVAPRSDPESLRMASEASRRENWKRWGPYLSERQWGTVREDYSPDGDCWGYLPHDDARSRAYRWGEDGILGICDRQCRLCFAVALWNGRDPILKERMFGLTNPEGNHGEDVKEHYFFLDSTPTHSYLRGLYKYPQAAFPYRQLVEENARRGKQAREYEIDDTGVFDGDRYFDVEVEYAKASPEDILIRITAHNRGPEAAALHVLPTLWFRNMWSWGVEHEEGDGKPALLQIGPGAVRAEQMTLGEYLWLIDGAPGPDAGGRAPELLFTENETNTQRLFGWEGGARFVKDAFHRRVIHGEQGAVNPERAGTKAAAWHVLMVPAGGSVAVRSRLTAAAEQIAEPFGPEFDRTIAARRAEADRFYAECGLTPKDPAGALVARQAYAGLLWSKQFYHYVVEQWLEGDPKQPPAPEPRRRGRNAEWGHLFNRDVISMPDTWEYPWYAAWDLAFQMLPFARIDPRFAKQQLVLFLREWYMHPSGALPAYEFALGDANPPVHAWACWRVYKMSGAAGKRDRVFLARCFQKLVLNFTWWVNRKDPWGKNIFAGGFLGLDNIGVFDRSADLRDGESLAQADGTAWMAFYCGTMLSMALELARDDRAYEDMASKFFEHFVAIADAMNHLGGAGLWSEDDGFYHDVLLRDGRGEPLKVRSMVGLVPLLAVEVLDEHTIARLPGFSRRMHWFLQHRPDLARHIAYMQTAADGAAGTPASGRRLLALPSRERLVRVLRYMLDENEFLSPHGIRSLSRAHREGPGGAPLVHRSGDREFRVAYDPAESTSAIFGGNSNWRGPIWFPLNFLLIEAMERYHYFYGESLRVECPTGSGVMMTLGEVARLLRRRLCGLFLPGEGGARPCVADLPRFARDPFWKDLVPFHEHFCGDTGRGLGASHQTGWTALVALMLEKQDEAGPAEAR